MVRECFLVTSYEDILQLLRNEKKNYFHNNNIIYQGK